MIFRNTSHRRQGLMTLELLVSAGLLVCMIGVLTPLTVRSGRLLDDSRQVRIALGELSNQIEVLTTYEGERLQAALAELTPSEAIRNALPGAALHGEIKDDGGDARLILTIDWDRPVKSAPLSLVAWLDSAAVKVAQDLARSSTNEEETSL